MKSHYRVVVIGGGVVGCSVLYHLTKKGWNDIILIERKELTSGSTWHAAGGFHTMNSDTNISALQGYTIRLYKELEAITGQSCGLHHVGGFTMANDNDRWDNLKAERAKHRYMGLNTELITPEEIAKLSPITNTKGVIGALYDPLDGHLDPSGTTHAYAKAAKMGGAEIILQNPVKELIANPDGSWQVITEKGTIHAEHVVNCGGLWAREVNAMAGVYLPLLPMEHQYLVTEELPEVYNHPTELPHALDPDSETYLRQEGRGLVIGFYEQPCETWAEKGTRMDFGHELLPNKLERIEASMEKSFVRYPVLARAGIKRVINGPFMFTPDGNPLVGPVQGLRNYWVACGVMAGFSQGGGVGLALSEWMADGEPSSDVFAMDVSRYGFYANTSFTRKKVVEFYQKRFSVPYPNEERPAARPYLASPAHHIWDSMNAVWGSAYGYEVVNYFAKKGEPRVENLSFRRSDAFKTIGEECRAVREKVGINEILNFGKFMVKGVGASDFLNKIFAGSVPKIGKISLTPMISPKGRLIGDFTIAHRSENCFQLTASFGAQNYHLRWFQAHLPKDGSVSVENISTELLGFQIAGPHAREVLAKITTESVSNQDLPFLGVRQIEIGNSLAWVNRVTYTGDLGYEIYVPANEQVPLFHLLWEAGKEFEMRPFGMRAMMSLRLEKNFGSWMREFRPQYTALETGLDRFISYNKPHDFIGKAAVLAEKAKGAERMLCAFVVDALDADVIADEPIWYDGKVVGHVTSGGYAHFVQKSVANGFLPINLVKQGQKVEIEILGERRPATLITEALFDPQATRMRG